MSNPPDAYRGVNKYIDYSTGEEHLEYSEPTDVIGTARMRATRSRHPNGKSRPTKKIGNRHHMVMVQSKYGGGPYEQREYTTHFEFSETWVEKVKEWERV